jgi:hypothetical protein
MKLGLRLAIVGYLAAAITALRTIRRLERRKSELRRGVDAAGGIVIVCDRGWRHEPPPRALVEEPGFHLGRAFSDGGRSRWTNERGPSSG